MDTSKAAPSTSAEFDKIYRSSLAHWVWSDTRIPRKLKDLVAAHSPQTSLELGCGLGRFSTYMAEQGIQATGVDFSAVAIGKARQRVAERTNQPAFLVGDVTRLEMLTTSFDLAFDIGCFHCLDEAGQIKYAEEMNRLLRPGSVLLIWALDSSPSGVNLDPDHIFRIFKQGFQLKNTAFSRRRIIASHWYWLVRG
jgi:SAM-dependent methyltransferase